MCFTTSLVLQESRQEFPYNLRVITGWGASAYPPRASPGAGVLLRSTSTSRLRQAVKSSDPNRTCRPVRVIGARVEGDGTLRDDTKDYAEFHRIEPNKLRPHQHAGVEIIYVITRRLGLRIGLGDSLLEGGDSVYFDSSVAHGYWNATDGRTTAVVVTVR